MVKFEISKDCPRLEANKHWQFCVGSGQAKLALRTDYVKLLKKVHDELGIKRVRFHGIFDDSMQTFMGLDDFMSLPGASNFQNYNFRNIGIAYDNILSAGMQPWVELSFMPSRLAKSKKKVGVNADGRCTMPKNDDEWINFIQAFIRYLLHRYGRDEVEQWYFEVWNEPNVATFFNGSKEDYFHLYEITSQAIKSIDNKIMIGGPATATGAWIPEFIDFCESKGLPLDFISTHNYPGDAIGDLFLGKIVLDAVVGGARRLKKKGSGRAIDGMRQVMLDKSEFDEMPKGQMYQHTKAISQQVAGRYPLFYSEWNCNAILSSETNDMKKVACFDVKSISEMEEFVTGSSIWCFSDIFDEFLLFPDEFSGGFGLLTIDGIPKPQFYALKLLNETGNLKFDLPYTNDEIEITAYDRAEYIHIFVYRQRMKNSSAAAEPYEIEMELDSVPNQVEIIKIDDSSANPLKQWENMGRPNEMNSIEIQKIIEESRPLINQLDFNFEDGKLRLSDKISVNDVHCYIIKK